MKRTIRIILAALVMFSFITSSAFALENSTSGLSERIGYSENLEMLFQNRIPPYLAYRGGQAPSFEKSTPGLRPESMARGTAEAGAAVAASFILHETGHLMVADHVGASGVSMNFLKKQDNAFFLGLTNVQKINDQSLLPFSMGGEFAADITFEYALQSYRENPTVFNRTLLLMSGTDFVRYSAYAFYMTGGSRGLDPVEVSRETGLSKNTIFSVALAKTMLNAYRVYSGRDTVVPYFSVDMDTVVLNLRTTF